MKTSCWRQLSLSTKAFTVPCCRPRSVLVVARATLPSDARLRRLMCGRALPFRNRLFQADGLRPVSNKEGVAHNSKKASTEGQSPSAHQAAKPRDALSDRVYLNNSATQRHLSFTREVD